MAIKRILTKKYLLEPLIEFALKIVLEEADSSEGCFLTCEEKFNLAKEVSEHPGISKNSKEIRAN
jgi:hypothetical protein